MPTSLLWIVAGLFAFLLGAKPSGLWIGRLARGIDVREHGSGNLGATNVYRTLGPGWGLLVLFLDILKGWVAVRMSVLLVGGESAVWAGLLGVFAALLGHMFSPYAGFKGGKGVATGAGGWLGLAPEALGLTVLVWALLFAAFRIVSLASIVAAAALPVLLWVLGTARGWTHPLFLFGVLTAALLVLRHASNIRRLFRGQEGRLDLSGSKREGGSA